MPDLIVQWEFENVLMIHNVFLNILGILDNSIIDMLWKYFIKKIPVSDEVCHASVELLRMAALSRRTIITRNLKLVTSVG